MAQSKPESQAAQGVVYIAKGASYRAEAIVSATSLKQWHPNLHVTLYTDARGDADCFDQVCALDTATHPQLARLQALCHLPYERTLYLDTDTFVCGDILEIFQPLAQFEFSAMLAPYRYRPEDETALGEFMQRIPRSYPQLNAGVMLFRRTARVETLMTRWVENYTRDLKAVRARGYKHSWYAGIGDQGALREALYDTPLAWWALPCEYNCILTLPGYVQGEVKILHGRHIYFQRAVEHLNSIRTPRVYHLDNNYLVLVNDKGHATRFDLQPYQRSLIGQLRHLNNALKQYGWRDTLRRVWKNFSKSL